jgi:O-antigen/teichoic acid export membrane protein
MMNESPAPTSAQSPQSGSLSQRAARGIFFVVGNSMIAKVIVLVQQIALAYLFTKDDFGLVGTAISLSMFASLLVNPGIDTILTRRPKVIDRWANAAFWLAIAGGLLAALTMVIAGWVGAWAFKEPRITAIMAVAAIALPIQAATIVPAAYLASSLQFRLSTTISLCTTLVIAPLTIAFAWLGYGAYSVFLAGIAGQTTSLILLFWAARPKIRLAPQFYRWPRLIGDGYLLLLSKVCQTVTAQGDTIALNVVAATATAGNYYFASNLSVVGIRMIAGSVAGVLLPALAQIDDPNQRLQATLRATRLLALTVIPFCMAQAVLALPTFRLMYGTKWDSAVWLYQMLTLGQMSNCAVWAAGPMLMTQGRLKTNLAMWAMAAVAFALVVFPATYIGEDRGTAIGVAIYLLIASIIGWMMIMNYRGAMRELLTMVWKPALASVLAGLLALTTTWIPMNGRLAAAGVLGLGMAVFGASYLLVVALLDRRGLEEVLAMLPAKIRRFMPFVRAT